jgi:hypothetical protein
MLRISAQTKLNPEVVIERAEKFFGANGQGLETLDRGSGCISFQGGGGKVEITTCFDDGDKRTNVDITTQEWEVQVKDFLGKLP